MVTRRFRWATVGCFEHSTTPCGASSGSHLSWGGSGRHDGSGQEATRREPRRQGTTPPRPSIVQPFPEAGVLFKFAQEHIVPSLQRAERHPLCLRVP